MRQGQTGKRNFGLVSRSSRRARAARSASFGTPDTGCDQGLHARYAQFRTVPPWRCLPGRAGGGLRRRADGGRPGGTGDRRPHPCPRGRSDRPSGDDQGAGDAPAKRVGNRKAGGRRPRQPRGDCWARRRNRYRARCFGQRPLWPGSGAGLCGAQWHLATGRNRSGRRRSGLC